MSSAGKDSIELPKGWKIQTIENLFKIKSGEFLSAQMMDENGLYDVYGGNGINGKYNKYNLRDENIIIGRVGANCGNVRLVNDKLWITDNAFYISEYFKDINKKYLYNFLSYIELGKTPYTLKPCTDLRFWPVVSVRTDA
jgi:type I restriction enzyme S subunit